MYIKITTRKLTIFIATVSFRVVQYSYKVSARDFENFM